MRKEIELRKRIAAQQKEIDDLKVLVDTAQAALRRAETAIKDPDDLNYVINQSAKWVLNTKL